MNIGYILGGLLAIALYVIGIINEKHNMRKK